MALDRDGIADVVARCREAAAPVTVHGIEGFPSVNVRFVPRNASRVDIDVAGAAPGGQALGHATALVRMREPGTDLAATGPDGTRWGWGDFMEERDRPDLCADPSTDGDNGMAEDQADALCAAIADAGARFAADNPEAMRAAGVVALHDAMTRVEAEEVAARRRADDLAARLPRLRERLAAEAEACDAMMDAGPSPAP